MIGFTDTDDAFVAIDYTYNTSGILVAKCSFSVLPVYLGQTNELTNVASQKVNNCGANS